MAASDAQPIPHGASEPDTRPTPRRYFHEACLAALVLLVLGAHLGISNTPRDAYIFDEAYYVPAARAMLLGAVSNVEHPPLAKLLIAASIRAFGDVGFAWRLPSIIAGTLAIVLLYALTRRLGDRKTALLAAFLLTFETLWFTHSSIAMLDIVAVSLGLLALLAFVRGEWVWAGAVIGLSMLAKETTVILIAVVTLFAWLQAARPFTRDAIRGALKAGFFVTASAFVVFVAGLQIYDSVFSAFPTAFGHVLQMIRYNGAITSPAASDAVRPLQWFSGFAPSGYFLTFANVGKDLKRFYVQYYGQPNLVVVLLVWLAVPFAVLQLKKKNENATLHLLLLLVPLAFFAGVSLWRITYPYYMLVSIPSICVLAAMFLSQFPRAVLLTYCAGVVMWFLVWFPRNLLTIVWK